MVGSISFSKKEGDYIKKGDEVHNSRKLENSFYISFHSEILKFIKFSNLVSLLQFGYFSFGGSTVICVFEKVSTIICFDK